MQHRYASHQDELGHVFDQAAEAFDEPLEFDCADDEFDEPEFE